MVTSEMAVVLDTKGPYERLLLQVNALLQQRQAEAMKEGDPQAHYRLVREGELLTNMKDQLTWAYLKSFSPRELRLHREQLHQKGKVHKQVEILFAQYTNDGTIDQ